MERSVVRLMVVWGCGCLVACAQDLPPQRLDAGPPDTRQDALVGTVGAETGPRPRPTDQGLGPGPDGGDPGPVPDAAPEPCAPFSRIDTCAICNAEGMPEMPETDGTCPRIECPESLFYERMEMNGEAVCFENRRTGGVDADCAEVGRCSTLDERCGVLQRMEISRAAANPCAGMVGCMGQEPPMVQELGLGDECNRFGRCDAGGECTVPAACGQFDLDVAREFCDGSASGTPYCEFLVHRRDDSPFSCETFCLENGATCLRAWNDDGGCGHDREIDCNAELREYICQCRVN